MARAPEREAGKTNFGDDNVQGQVHIRSHGVANSPALLAMDSVSDSGSVTTRYLWIDSTGDLRTGTSKPTDQDADGAAVGDQTSA